MPTSIDPANLFESVDAAADIARTDERCIRSGAILYFQISPGQIGYVPAGPRASVTELINTRMLDPQATIVCKELHMDSIWERRRCSDDA
jgi:hypothetical protein